MRKETATKHFVEIFNDIKFTLVISEAYYDDRASGTCRWHQQPQLNNRYEEFNRAKY